MNMQVFPSRHLFIVACWRGCRVTIVADSRDRRISLRRQYLLLPRQAALKSQKAAASSYVTVATVASPQEQRLRCVLRVGRTNPHRN